MTSSNLPPPIFTCTKVKCVFLEFHSGGFPLSIDFIYSDENSQSGVLVTKERAYSMSESLREERLGSSKVRKDRCPFRMVLPEENVEDLTCGFLFFLVRNTETLIVD